MSVRSFRFSLLGSLLSLLGTAQTARAEQFIVTDVTYTHSAETTSDSHYRVSPSSGTPKNWKSPVDYSTGSAHVLLEVKTKPASNTPTKFQICFEGSPTYACTDQSLAYTKPGIYEWTSKVQKFWSPEGQVMDWTQGVKKVALILKDDNNDKPQGDPRYVPSDLRVEVAIITAGDSYTKPEAPSTQVDAGTPVADASTPRRDEDSSSPTSARDASADAPVRESPRDASVVVRQDAGRTDAAVEAVVPEKSDDGGCTLANSASAPSGLLGLSLLLLARPRRRRHAR